MDSNLRARRAQVGDETQIDMVVSMFAALLVLLLTLAVGGSADQAEQTGDRTQYRAADPPTDAFSLRTACVLNPRKTYYILRHGTLWRINDAQIAANWRAAGGGVYAQYDEDHDFEISVKPVEGAPPGSYQTLIRWRGDTAPDALTHMGPAAAWTRPAPEEIPPQFHGPATIFARTDEDPDALYALAAALQTQGLRPEILRAKIVKITWSAASYTEDSVFRC